MAPQKDWSINEPEKLAVVLGKFEAIQKEFNAGEKKVSMADLIVLGGCAAVEKAAKDGGVAIKVPFHPGRTDATQEMTDVNSFAVLEPRVDEFRNYHPRSMSRPGEQYLVDKAQLLTLSAPEMTVLVGGLRVLNAGYNKSTHGQFTDKPGVLTNDFFVNLLDMKYRWQAVDNGVFDGIDRKTGERKWVGSRSDLIFGSNSQLRAIAESYACNDSKERFVKDFVAAWTKVMNLDRFDLDSKARSGKKVAAK